ncbi:MAG: septal ring lytic transglycosylase RlpA family protein, partial [Thermodesulfobacteriota bacterium]
MQNTKTALLITVLLIYLSGINGCGRVKIISHPVHITPSPSKIQKSTQQAYRIKGKTYYPIPDAKGFSQRGLASWYGPPFHGRKTSNGETYNMYGKTAAHKTMPMGTHVLVQNLENNRKTVVRINDRGPFVRGRIIDLSKKAAKDIGMLEKGTARVEITALGETVTVKKGQKEIK